MSETKKKIRKHFRDFCFKRDKYSCVTCGYKSSIEKAIEELDCHHIIPRTELANQGYTSFNGISLCSSCHQKAEDYYCGISHPGFTPDDLFKLIGSSKNKAIEMSNKL